MNEINSTTIDDFTIKIRENHYWISEPNKFDFIYVYSDPNNFLDEFAYAHMIAGGLVIKLCTKSLNLLQDCKDKRILIVGYFLHEKTIENWIKNIEKHGGIVTGIAGFYGNKEELQQLGKTVTLLHN